MAQRILTKAKRTSISVIAIAIAVLLSGAFNAIPQKANALSGLDFKAGRIIDDAVFYNSSTMSVQQIQAFLNQKVVSCDTSGSGSYNGTTRAAYAASRGYPAPFTCLKDYSQNVGPMIHSGSDLCPVSIPAGGNKSAAQIIYDVSQSCQVNPQILLVLLEKEQGLVTDDWPWQIQYRSATGYGCPDTAACDSDYYGFYNQLFNAAQAFKRYAANTSNYNYRSGRNNTVLYNPQSSCGNSSVYIENQATAGLYTYTPYQPNSAALSNIYGSGDDCSSYGNRNFWRLFSDWFGSTTGPDYAWQINSADAYTDTTYTQRVTNGGGAWFVKPSQKFYIKITGKNIGRTTWYPSNTRLGTYSPFDYASPFHDSSWLSNMRVTPISESSVAPGQTATFTFAATAPASAGSYTERYGIVVEGTTWLTNTYVGMSINVTNPSLDNSQSTLITGATMKAGSVLYSPDRNSVLKFQTNGNLEVYTNFTRTWQSNTAGSGATTLSLTQSGNLVLSNDAGTSLWSTNTSSSGGTLVMQTDGNLVLYGSNGVTWSSGTTFTDQSLITNQKLMSGNVMYSGQWLTTPDGRYRLVLQTDGNLVLYGSRGALWSSGTYGKKTASLIAQPDGNLVLYNTDGYPIWASGTYGAGYSTLVMQTDGNLVLYGSGRPVWSSGTYNR